MSTQEKFLLCTNLAIYGFLTVFSYSYVDLNLTISQNRQVLESISIMQQLGYYNRPQATLIYLIFIIFAFSFFIINLWLFHKSKIAVKYLAVCTLCNTIILILAYPFLSSDLFNYLFDAKIILKYHLSPYTHKPLDFPQDDWLRFMRWVHRYSPYGPLWLGMSIIPAALGFGKFILNFIAFKIFIASFHLLNSFIIYKFLQKTHSKQLLLGTAFYALNPLFLIEGIANAHNDVLLSTFLLATIFFLYTKQKIQAYGALFLGVFIKYIPVLNLPWLIISTFKRNDKDQNRTILLSLATMAVFTYLFSSFKITVPFVSSGATQVQFQPWYLFWTIPYISMLPMANLIIPALAVSLGASLRYLPYLYLGDWSHPPTNTFMQLVTILPLLASILILTLKRYFQK